VITLLIYLERIQQGAGSTNKTRNFMRAAYYHVHLQWSMSRIRTGDSKKHGIERVLFADAVVALLALGRGKGRNIYITGPTNCGKTFILDPLRVIFNTFPFASLLPVCMAWG